MSDFNVVGSRPNKTSYRYNPSRPLVSPQGNLSRGYTTEEMTRIIEISESAANPNKTNASDIPVFLFFEDKNGKHARSPTVTIPPGSNKYYCRLQAFPEHSSGNYPDTPQGLANISFLHANQMIKELKEKNHSLPMTVVYQVGMNNNHTGTVAFRISSLDDPSKNEIMVINSLPGYSKLENAAIQGIAAAMKVNATAPNKEKAAQKIIITPETTGIRQATSDMNASCSAITAAMSCAISPEQSFAEQKENLTNHMKNLTGLANEGALRRDHQAILALPHPSSSEFNSASVKNVLGRCERFRNKINTAPLYATNSPTKISSRSVANPPKNKNVVHNKAQGKSVAPDATVMQALYTPNEFVKSVERNPGLLSEVQKKLSSQGKSLFDICSSVTDPSSVVVMFRNTPLMDAIRAEGKDSDLLHIHLKVLTTTQIIPQQVPKQRSKETNHEKPIHTADEFVKAALYNPDLITKFKDKSGSLYDLCNAVSDETAIKNMFFNDVLMTAIETEQSGNKQKLIAKHSDVFHAMWPNYGLLNTYDSQARGNQKGRDHTYTVSINDAGVVSGAFKSKYSNLKGDHLKTQILDEFKSLIQNAHTIDDLNQLKETLEKSPGYKILKTAQGSTTRLFGFTTSSVKALDKMFEDQKEQISHVGLTPYRRH